LHLHLLCRRANKKKNGSGAGEDEAGRVSKAPCVENDEYKEKAWALWLHGLHRRRKHWAQCGLGGQLQQKVQEEARRLQVYEEVTLKPPLSFENGRWSIQSLGLLRSKRRRKEKMIEKMTSKKQRKRKKNSACVWLWTMALCSRR
jgi:hypothetical protein